MDDFVTKTVVLFPDELRTVEKVQTDLGLSPRSGFSQALRYIIRDWKRMRSQTPEALSARGEGETANK